MISPTINHIFSVSMKMIKNRRCGMIETLLAIPKVMQPFPILKIILLWPASYFFDIWGWKSLHFLDIWGWKSLHHNFGNVYICTGIFLNLLRCIFKIPDEKCNKSYCKHFSLMFTFIYIKRQHGVQKNSFAGDEKFYFISYSECFISFI